MSETGADVQRWTRRFVLASAGSLVAFFLARSTGGGRLAVALAVFAFLCPMVFGMGYLLLPPYVGATLADERLPGVHFPLAYVGAGFLVVGWLREGVGPLFAVGAVLWACGVAVFVGALLVTVVPAVLERPAVALRWGDNPQRSTRLATATLPVALGYLVVATVALLEAAGVVGDGSLSLAQVGHFYAVGFAAVLVYALGGRLLIGFFHVEPPRVLLWIVLLAGSLAPVFLGGSLWLEPWFRIGAVLGAVAMGGYLFLVADVAIRTDRRPPGLYGIVLGAVAGALAVATSVPLAFGVAPTAAPISVHRTLVLGGFFPLTIVGYAFRFFPVTTGRFRGASRRGAIATIGALAAGVGLQALGLAIGIPAVHSSGIALSLLGALGYAYLLTRRFLG